MKYRSDTLFKLFIFFGFLILNFYCYKPEDAVGEDELWGKLQSLKLARENVEYTK